MIILTAALLTVCTFLPQTSALAGQFGVTTTGTNSYPTSTFGNTGSTGAVGGLTDILIATKYTLTTPGTVTQIGAYAASAGHWKIGIYSDNAGSPGTLLVANNAATAVTAGDNSIDVSPTYLSAGTYWVAILTDAANRIYSAGTGQAAYIIGYGFANSLPGNFGTPTGIQGNDYLAYATYVKVEGYAKATKVTLSDDNSQLITANFYAHTTGTYRLAIYSDNSGPNTKLWESSNTAAVPGWNTIDISSGTPSGVTLTAGTYWLVYQWNSANAGPSYTAGAMGDGKSVPMTYGSFPSTWSAGSSTSEKYSIYITYTSGLTVLPENQWGSFVAVAMCFSALGIYVKFRKSLTIH
jgi:uncharacterized protein (DUF2141 family)